MDTWRQGQALLNAITARKPPTPAAAAARPR